ncbi:MAG: aromatic ring-hydroxylating dioxygenase subunit alpha [Rubrivivax sp.]
MFVRNSWYVAAWSDEIEPGKLLGRTLLGDAVLLYRGESGRLAALEDRCCHRGLPLSLGSVQGDRVQCGYHGLVFDACGTCVKVPGQERVPPKARVKHYEVIEQDHLVWIWMGDAASADQALVPSHPWHGDPAWGWVKDRYLVRANYQLITDNLMDLTHVGYVHTKTIGGTPQAHSEAEMKVEATERGIKVSRFMPDSVPPPSYTAFHTFATERVDRWMEIEFFPPVTVRVHTGAVDTGTGAREGNRSGGFAFMGLNVQTPETESTTHYFWSGARTQKRDNPVDAVQMLKNLATTFAEDKFIIEAQQISLDRKPEPLVMIANDAGTARSRRLVTALLEAEGQAIR